MAPVPARIHIGVLGLLLGSGPTVRGDDVELAALATDGQCGNDEDGACALSARQVRGLKFSDVGTVDAADGGSCQAYGCTGYVSSHSCQCNAKCHQYGNCCHDYAAQCGSTGITVPSGVNLGGWLVLEDWFFSGTGGRHVMSKDGKGQGTCLPPLLHTNKETWPSEGILTRWLERSQGREKAVEVFDAHRKAFICDDDLRDIARLGIRQIRLPVPWTTFADALAPLDAAYASGAKVVPDPYYFEEASFVTVHRSWLKDFLRKAAKHNLKVYLDMHTMPGGSSDATYSGVWPLPPKFWMGEAQIGKNKVPLTKVGLWIVDAFVKWVENLGEVELGAVAGMTLLNEPAHMSHIDLVKGKPFVESEEQVMNWTAEAADRFRQSALPGKGLKLHVSVIDSAFQYYWDTAPPFWNRTFTPEERHSWAVFDIHFYDAWTPKCSGRTKPGGGYMCDQPLEEIRSLLHSCHADYMALFAKNVDGLKACTEFSVATFEDPVFACKDEKLLQMYLEEQVDTFKRFEIDAFFWSWRMPHGKNFQSAWSLKHLAGLEKTQEDSGC